MKRLCSILLAILMATSVSTTAFAAVDTSPNVPSNTKTATTTGTAVKPVKSYTVAVGKNYTLPTPDIKTGDSFATSDAKVLTVNQSTGAFTTVANGTAYIIVTNNGAKRYIQITVGTGANTTTGNANVGATTGKSALNGYTVTVSNKTTVATTSSGNFNNGVYTHYFLDAKGNRLGNISHKDMLEILKNPKAPTESKDYVVWLAEEFNVYRGVSSGGFNTLVNANELDTSSYRSDLSNLINQSRKSNNLYPLTYDSNLQSYADTRAKEIATSFSHNRPNGEQISYVEIITSDSNPKGTATTAFNNFYNSAPHKANMLHNGYQNFAIGFYQTQTSLYWVVVFSR